MLNTEEKNQFEKKALRLCLYKIRALAGPVSIYDCFELDVARFNVLSE